MVVDADERSLASLCDCHLPEARTQSCLRAPPAHADQSTVTDASDRAEREHQIVHCRIRPVLPFDEESDDPGSHASPAPGEVAHAVDDETVQVKCSRPGHPPINKTFTFERVYRPADPQREVFGDVRPLLTSLLDGYNVCIMAYGQTGSGKSYTMLGPRSEVRPVLPPDCHSDLGLVPRAAEELFRLISENPSRRAKVEVSIVEVYNDDIFDLLAEDTCTATPGVKCEVLTTKEGRKEVSPLTCTSVRSAQECMMLVGAGLQLRAMRATSAHAHSSRSHLIITVALTTTPAWDSSGPGARRAEGLGHLWSPHSRRAGLGPTSCALTSRPSNLTQQSRARVRSITAHRARPPLAPAACGREEAARFPQSLKWVPGGPAWRHRWAHRAGPRQAAAGGPGGQRVCWCVWSDRVSPEGDVLYKPEPGRPRRRPGGPFGAPRPHSLQEQQAHPRAAGCARRRCKVAGDSVRVPLPEACG
ncbi:PREDICTED: kinesin-like protein KIF25 isoform X2 [Hipposideros armiger]|uniref:Kinesin-like protein KIF25 isoform X2 n=1 Tax=Hipposideros armiger TaxID=186990 RepID=A0A8B7SSJ3_HIPAR|nr:PREDICTED: kinesin-like protein KIF25 isoform X2 [Hipposideros armiger]